MIYFARQIETDYIKVGRSSTVFKRLSCVGTEFGGRMVLIGVMPGNPKDEVALHRSLDEFRLIYHKPELYPRYNVEWYYPFHELINRLAGKLDVDYIRQFIADSDRVRSGREIRRSKMNWLINVRS